MKTKLGAKLEMVNECHLWFNTNLPALRKIFAPFIGKKISNKNMRFTKPFLNKNISYPYMKDGRYRIYPTPFHLMVEINFKEFKGEEPLYNLEVPLAYLSSGVLTGFYTFEKELKCDYTEEEVLGKREKYRSLLEEIMSIQNEPNEDCTEEKCRLLLEEARSIDNEYRSLLGPDFP